MQDIYSMNIKRMRMLNRKFDTNRNTKKKEKNNLNFFFIKEKILKAKQQQNSSKVAVKAVICRNIARY